MGAYRIPWTEAGESKYLILKTSGAFLRMSVLRREDFDGIGHLCQGTNLCGRLRGVLPAGRGKLYRER